MSKDDFKKTRLTFAFVVHSDLETVEQLKNYLITLGLEIIYQKCSAGKLWVVETQPENLGGVG